MDSTEILELVKGGPSLNQTKKKIIKKHIQDEWSFK